MTANNKVRTMMGIRLLLISGLLMLATAACAPQARMSDLCQQKLGQYPVRYSGTAHGYGELEIAPAEQPGALAVLLKLYHPERGGQQVVMQIHGSGQCRDGTVRARFGGRAAEDNPNYKILGGQLVGVLDPGVMSGAFGRWEMEVLSLADKQQRQMSGFWVQVASLPW